MQGGVRGCGVIAFMGCRVMGVQTGGAEWCKHGVPPPHTPPHPTAADPSPGQEGGQGPDPSPPPGCPPQPPQPQARPQRP